MTFLASDLVKVAKLARLALSDEEKQRFIHDLDRIIGLVAELDEVDVTDVLPMSHAGNDSLHLREDIPIKVLGRECVRSSAGYDEGLIRVPKIIE